MKQVSTWKKAIPLIRKWGLNYVDLRSRIFQRPIEKLTDEQLADVKKLLDANGLKAACIQSSLGKVHLPDKERLKEENEKLDRIIAASQILECNLIRSFFFWQPPGRAGESRNWRTGGRPDVLAQVMELFLPFAEKAKKGRIAFRI